MKKFITSLLLILSSSLWAEEVRLSKGHLLDHEFDARSPLQYVLLAFEGGAGSLSVDEQAVVGYLNELIPQGPSDVPLEEFRHRMFLLGSRIGVMSFPSYQLAFVGARPEHLEQSLRLVAQACHQVRFDQESWDRARQNLENAILARGDNLAEQLDYFAERDFFSYQARVMDGRSSLKSLKNITPALVKSKVPELFNARHLQLVSSGPMARQDVVALIEKTLGDLDWFKDPYTARQLPGLDAKRVGNKPYRAVLLHKEGASDNQIRLMVAADLSLDNAAMLSERFAMQKLGGGPMGDLFKILREKRGLSYSAAADADFDLDTWSVRTFGELKNVKPLLLGAMKIVQSNANMKIDQDTLKSLQLSNISSWAEQRELPLNRSMSRLQLRLEKRDLNFFENQDRYIRSLTAADVEKAAKKLFSKVDFTLYVIGDKAKLLNVLKSSGFKKHEIRILDAGDIN